MPRTHAPTLAAILGVGLVLAITRSPGAEVRPEVVLRAVEASDDGRAKRGPGAAIAGATVAVTPEEMAAASVGGPVPMHGMLGMPGSTAAVAATAAPETSAIIVEAPEVLAGFEIPRDRMGLLAGTHAESRSRLAFGGAAAQPAIVALVASWCAPCAAELPHLVELSQAEGLRLVLVSLDDIVGPESLTAVIEDMFARAEPSSRALPPVELRADPEATWTDATAPLLIDRGDPGALPQTLLLSGDGKLRALVQGGFDVAIAERLAVHVEHLRPFEGCR